MRDDTGAHPFERLAEEWSKQARAASDAFRTMLATATAASNDSQLEAMDGFQRWLDMSSQMSRALISTLRKVLEELSPEDVSRPPDAEWDALLQRMSELPPEMAERLSRADPERMTELFRSMAAEYLADLEAFEDQWDLETGAEGLLFFLGLVDE